MVEASAKNPTGTIRHRCPHCKRDTFLAVSAPQEEDQIIFGGPAWLEKLHPDLDAVSNAKQKAYLTETWTKCPESDCRGPIYLAIRWVFSGSPGYLAAGGWHRTSLGSWAKILSMLPDGNRAELDPAVPERIRTEWAGLIDLAEQHRSPAVVTMGCRAVLELACKELEDQSAASNSQAKAKRSANLQDRIDNLASAGVITHTLKDWSHQLRLDGNDGAHELKGDPERALTFARFVEFFLEASFVMNARLRSIQRLPTEPATTGLEDILG